MKTKEELNALKAEVETLNKKLRELTDDELRLVVGGLDVEFIIDDKGENKEFNFYDNTTEKEFKPKFPTGLDK